MLPFLLYFTLYLRAIFQVQAPRGRFKWGLCVTSLGGLYLEGLIFGILRYIKGEGNLSFGSLKGPKRANSSVLQKRLSSQLPMQSNWCLTPSADRARFPKRGGGWGPAPLHKQFTRILVESSNVHNFFLQNTCLNAKCYIDSKVFYLKILSDNV